MATNNKWKNKEARELFCKTVNSMLMRLPEGQGANIETIVAQAKEVVDRAFSYYPEEEAGEDKEEKFDFQ